MPRYLAQVTLPYITNIPSDVTVNTFAFSELAAPGTLGQIAQELISFYNDVQANTFTIAQHLGEGLNRAADACTVDIYDADTLPMGSPIHSDSFTLGPTTDAFGAYDLPAEIAACLSFHGNLSGVVEEAGTTRPRARRRGRIYLGPLKLGVASGAAEGQPVRVLAQFRTTVAQAAEALRAGSNGINIPWQVWSRVDNVMRPVVGGWIDDAFDVQRRRGVDPSVRLVWP